MGVGDIASVSTLSGMYGSAYLRFAVEANERAEDMGAIAKGFRGRMRGAAHAEHSDDLLRGRRDLAREAMALIAELDKRAKAQCQ